MFSFKVQGMKELKKSLKKLGEVPQKHVTSSVKKAMNIPLKEARRNAPRKTGNLERGLISVGERSSSKGKKVYRIVFDRNMNDIFQRPVKNPGKYTPKGKDTAYYPISQEYGFFRSDGKFIPPKAGFGRKALSSKAVEVEKSIVDSMQKKIDKEIAKGGLKK